MRQTTNGDSNGFDASPPSAIVPSFPNLFSVSFDEALRSSLSNHATFPAIDLAGISAGLLQGGADSVFSRFNVRTHSPFEENAKVVMDALSRDNIYAHLLGENRSAKRFWQKAVTPEEFHFIWNAGKSESLAFYFERFPAPVGWPKDLRDPDRPRGVLSLAAGRMSDWARRRCKVPDMRGMMILTKEPNSTQMEFAIASRIAYAGEYATIAGLNQIVMRDYKVFDTSLMVDQEKRVNDAVSSEALRSLAGHASKLWLRMRCKEPLGWIEEIAGKFGLSVIGGMSPDERDVLGGSYCAISSEAEASKIEFRRSAYDAPDQIDLALKGFSDERLLDCYHAVLSKLKLGGASSSREKPYRSMFADQNSDYLPPFPFASHYVISIDYLVDGTPFGKPSPKR